MKSKFNFTGTNIAASLLVIAYFFPWADSIISISGFSLTKLGVSPGLFAFAINGISRLALVLLLLVPVCGALIVYQNVTGNMQFNKYYKSAHIIPAVLLLVLTIGGYFKMRSSVSDSMAEMNNYGGMSNYMPKISTPGLFDILSFGAYLSLAAAIYLLLVNMGKIKDKEYFKTVAESPTAPTTVSTTTPTTAPTSSEPTANS